MFSWSLTNFCDHKKIGSPRNSCPKTCFKSSCETHPVPWKSKKLKSSCHAPPFVVNRRSFLFGGDPKKFRPFLLVFFLHAGVFWRRKREVRPFKQASFVGGDRKYIE